MRKILTFLIAVSSPLLLFGQSPGGISTDLSLWYKGDNGVTTNASKLVTQWTSSSTNSVPLTPSGSAILPYNDQTTYNNTLNFNPTVTFDGTNNYLRNNTTAYLNTAGSVHYIVVAKGTNRNTNYQSLFAIAGNDDGFFYSGQGATTAFPSIGNNFNSSAAAIASPEDLGIYSSILPKTAVQGTQRGFYNGLKKNYTSPYPITGGSYSLPTTGAYIGADGTTGDNFYGDIAEVILYHNTTGGDLADVNLEKIHSYLAVKYGITLTSTQNYVTSANQIVWNAGSNSGFTSNIFGIGRDDASALHQKQSTSTNTAQKLIIGNGGSLFGTNALNTNSLTNGQFLIVGDNGLKQAPIVALANPSAPGGATNYRFASIWKVQNTGVGSVTIAWPAGLENFQLIRSTDSTIDATDTFVPMTGTTTVNGVTYNTATVTFNDGEYFSFASYVHAPGGVLSSLWYRADKGLLPATGAVTTWTDYSAGQVPVSPALSSSTSAPTSVAGTGLNLNFNPGVTFVAANALGNSGVLNALSGANYTVYTSTTPVTGSGWDRVVGLNYSNLTGGNSYDSPGLGADNVIIRTNTGAAPLFSTVATGYRYDQLTNTTIVRNSFTNTLFTRAFNGAVPGGNITYSSITTGPDGGIVLGRNANAGGDDNGAGMTMAETIVFDAALSANEVNRVDSYLAIKGGITLDNTNTPNYLSSTSANVWNGSTNVGYNNNIFGIANDFISALDQKQSISINAGQKLIIGAGNSLANTNALNTNTLTNGQFLIVGDNGLKQGLSVALANPAAPAGGTNYRFASVWKVQNTGSVGTVTIAWPSTGMQAFHLVRSTDATIDATDTFIPMSGTTTVNGVTYNTATVTLGDGNYFTFAAYVHAPGGVLSSLWYRADKGLAPATGAVTTWTDYSAGQVPVIPALSSTTSAPTSIDGIGANFNFNPAVTFVAANALGNTSVLNPTTGGNYTVYTSTGVATGDRIVGLGYSNLTGGASYDSPGIGADITGLRNAAGTTVMSYSAATGYKYTQFTNTTIARNSFTNTAFSRALNGSVAGASSTYSNTTTGPNGGIIFGRNANNGGDDGGAGVTLSETIVFDGALSVNDVNKVDSYLAIKGGITLDIVNTPNYLSSSSANVWSGSVNTGYNNNILGVAYDYVSDLNQKQSKSINDGQRLIIGAGGTLADTNALNTNTLTDGQFLIVGDNGLRQGLSVPISGITGVNYRFESIWKAQNTGTVGTVRVAWPAGLSALRLIQSADAVIENTDTVTDMSVNTQTVNGVTYNYADVTLANGQYFTFAAFAHAPGGVINGLSQWYRADIDATNTGNTTDVTSWKDYFGGTIVAQMPAVALPKYKIGDATYFNFNPGINFTAITQGLGNNTVQTITNTSNDIFTVTKEGMTAPGSPTPHFFSITENNSTSTIASWDYTGFWPVSATIERRVVGGGTQFVNSGVNFSAAIPSIMYNTFTASTLARGLNGAANGAIANNTAVGLALGGHVFGDTRFTGSGSDNGGIVGDIGETIIYGGGNITAAERRKVDTYLAIKYGITLGRVATDNYISTADGTVWSGALNTSYNNNIFGLAKDDIESLHQKVSKSVNAGTILIMATNNDFVSQNIDASRTALTGDQKYFLAGDNNVTATALNSITVNGSAGQRIQRTWLSQRTNATGTVYFSADLSTYGTSFVGGNNVRMIIADDAAFTTNVVSVPGVYSGGKWVHSHGFDSENTGRYITYVALPIDTDNDGIADSVDLDDDNDGILDSQETRCLTVNAIQPTPAGAVNTFASTGTPSFTTTFKISTVQTAAYIYTTSLFGYTNVTGVAAQTNTGSPINSITFNRSVYNLDVALDDVDGSETATLRFYDANNNLIPGSVVQPYVVFIGSQISSVTYPAGQSIYVTGSAAASTTVQSAVRITFPNTIGISRIEYEQVTTGGGGSNNGLLLMNGCVDIDTDGDGIWDRLDLDSDNDGCLDAIEGDENVTASMLVTAAPGLSVGTGSTASNQNLCASGSCVDTQGVPTIVNSGGAADIGSDQGQGVGTSANSAINGCPTNCYKPGAVASAGNPALVSKVGITSLNRAGTAGDNWPGIRTGGYLVLESKTKGFVPNRVAFSGANPVGIAPANFVEGMLVYDTTNKCMKMYTSQDGGTTFGWYCITTQTCPD